MRSNRLVVTTRLTHLNLPKVHLKLIYLILFEDGKTKSKYFQCLNVARVMASLRVVRPFR